MKRQQRWKRWSLGPRKNCEVDYNFLDNSFLCFSYGDTRIFTHSNSKKSRSIDRDFLVSMLLFCLIEPIILPVEKIVERCQKVALYCINNSSLRCAH